MSGLKKAWCILSLLLLTLTQLFAQQPPVTLPQLLHLVGQKSPALLTDSAAVLIRQAEATEIRSNRLPNLRLNYQADIGTNNNVAGPYFGYGIVPSNSRGVRDQSNTTTATVNLGIAAFDWEIYNFGAYGAQNKVARSAIGVEENQFAKSKYQLQSFTIGNYLQLLRLQDYLNIQSRNIRRNQEINRSIRSLAISGVRPGVDTSIAEAELSKARLNYIELDNQLKQIQLQLASVSGLTYQTIVPDTLAEQKLISQTSVVPTLNTDTSTHPLINYYRSVYKNNLLKEALVKKQYNPKIMLEAAAWGRGSSIDANDHFNSLGSGLDPQRGNYLVGLGISYNLFDLRRRHLKLNTQKTITNYALKQLDEQKYLLAVSASQADVEMNTARQRLQEIPNQLKAANAGYRQNLSLYRNGLINIIELNAALNILYRAETDYAEAKYAYANALFQKAITDNRVGSVLNLLNP
ncbi:TolC family protein [Mucilaginibacter sp.]|uniref:TolC family protein n=1 Tax=Mucilaginibacter sp. TaxID=1882438 RepID=UPI003B004A25